MADADRIRLAARVPADYEGYGYTDLLADDLKAVAGVAGDVAAASLAATEAKEDAEAAAQTAADDAVAAAVTQITADRNAADAAATSASASAASSATNATNAQTSRVAAENAVASVTVGSTNSLAYPEQVRNLVTAADVVDVCVYDTRLDSDGGAWTERTTGTSWYNEPLNTPTRGAKRAFPKIALIVARQFEITIYDALDLDPATSTPRMWMVFQRLATDATMIFTSTTHALTSIAAMNGRLYRGVGTVTNNRGLVMIDFIDDLAVRGGSSALWRYGIADRNVSNAALWVSGPPHAPQAAVNSLDLAVLPGARVSSTTGLPMPTLLVGGSTAFFVLHPTGDQAVRAANVTISGGYTRARFIRDGRIAAIINATTWAEVGPIPYAATTANTSWRTHLVGNAAATAGIALPDARFAPASGLVDLTEGSVAQVDRVVRIAEDVGDLTASMVAYCGRNSASGWMPHGRTVLAALGHGVTGSLTGVSNLVTNGTFATGDLTGWAQANFGTGAAPSVSSGVLQLPRLDASNFARLAQSFTTIPGETYLLTFDQVAAVSLLFRVATTITGGDIGNFTESTAGARALQFTAVGTTTWINFNCGADGATAQIDNVSVSPVAPGMTGYLPASALTPVGTLNRAVVATDAELVAYSGFSASNYLTQPSNTALAVGTGDVMVAGWVNVASFAVAFPLALAQGSDAIELGVGTTGFRFRLQSSTAATDLTVTSTTAITGQWVFVVGLRRAGTMEIWVNGAREATLAAAGTLTATPGALEVARSANASALTGLALLRVATYAPTPAQIARMFRDERPLFAAGAKAFLGGASTATVRRLSRSRYTNRLAVSMSDGLAIFDGLQRVERQTTATLSPAMASDSVTPISMEAGITLIGTASNAGVRRAAINGLDLMPINAASPQMPRTFRALGVTADATPLVLSPRVQIGERELVVVRALITARVYGAADTESITYERRATYYRDAGGNVTLRGSVQVIGTDVEVTSTADATLVIDTTAQTVAAQVTGIAATRLVWSARFQVERNSREAIYEEVV